MAGSGDVYSTLGRSLKADKNNFTQFLDLAATDQDADASDTWWTQGNYTTASNATTAQQAVASTLGGGHINVTDPYYDKEKTYSMAEAMGEIDTSDITYDTGAGDSRETAGTVLSAVGSGASAVGMGMMLSGVGALPGAIISGVGGAISGIGQIVGKSGTQREANTQEEYQKAVADRKRTVMNSWVQDAVAGNNKDYTMIGAEFDENGNYIEGTGTIKQKKKDFQLSGYGASYSGSGVG